MTLTLSKFIRLSHLAAFFFGVSDSVGSNPLKLPQEVLRMMFGSPINLMFARFVLCDGQR